MGGTVRMHVVWCIVRKWVHAWSIGVVFIRV